MKNTLISQFCFIILTFISSCEKIPFEDQHFSFKAIDTPSELSRSCAFYCVLGNKGYMGTGRNTSAQLNDFWSFDPQNLQWKREADFPGTSRVKGIAIGCNGNLYAGLGYSNKQGVFQSQSYLKDFYVYTPDSNNWKRLSDFPSLFSNSCIAFSRNNKVFVSLGYDGVTFSKQVWMFDPTTNLWTSIENKSGGGNSEAMCIDNGRIFAGANNYNWHEFDTVNFKWKKRTQMPDKGRIRACGFVIYDKIFVAGGRHWGGDGDARQTLQSIFQYKPENDLWVKAGDLPEHGFENGVSFSLGNKAFIGFGENDWGAVNTFWQVSIESNN